MHEVGKPSLNAAQPDAKAEGCVSDDPPRADKLQKGWSFRVVTWNIDSLTGRLGELVEVSAVMSMYAGSKTVVRTVYGNSKGFEVNVGMRQGSALSPLLFVFVMEAISREFRVALPWELLYADDLAVIAVTEEELIKRLNEWKDNVESKGMSGNMNKTKVMISGER